MSPRRLPPERNGLTHKINVDGTDVYITTGVYEDGSLGEVFIKVGKQGDEMRLMDIIGKCISIGLQHGIPLIEFTSGLKYQSMGTGGVTDDPDFPIVKSILDGVAKWLEKNYLIIV